MGVFLRGGSSSVSATSLPHARGGVSSWPGVAAGSGQSSPRPWGCFCPRSIFHSRWTVFPTPVGVFLPWARGFCRSPRLPHARGGVSISRQLNAAESASSPRPWGCFAAALLCADWSSVFPTPVGVFPARDALRGDDTCLPHARGGVSPWLACRSHDRQSSPRPWGCFSPGICCRPRVTVFPTPVGVFQDAQPGGPGGKSLPHARGGVSPTPLAGVIGESSSPRPWGCFRARVRSQCRDTVFPTPVGVFPRGAAM